MENMTVACVQQRMAIMDTREEFEAEADRFLHQARAKAAQLVVFPELTGLMLAPPLISGFKLGFIRRADQGSKPTAGLVRRRLGRVSGAAAGAIGGGFRGSLSRLLAKDSDALLDVYLTTFGNLAREYGTAILGGSLYTVDVETGQVRNRAYLFDASGEVLGYQDKLNLSPDEESLASRGSEMNVLVTPFGNVGLLIGQDALYPELARVSAMQGADVLVGIAASAGSAQARIFRSAIALRVEENQLFGAVSFLLGPNYVGQQNQEEYFGQSAVLAPISLTEKGDGVLVQAGTNRTESLIAAELDSEALDSLQETSRFRPRSTMNLGNHGLDLADFYREGQTIEQTAAQSIAALQVVEPELPAEETVPELVFEDKEEELAEPILQPEELIEEADLVSVPEALSLTSHQDEENREA
jgi:predicted amidohydrolase